MGREVRATKRGWQAPTNAYGDYLDHFEKPYRQALLDWAKDVASVKNAHGVTTMHEVTCAPQYQKAMAEISQCYPIPQPDDYPMPEYGPDDELQYAVYETVTAGTPITPWFNTKEELRDYLVNVGSMRDGKLSQEEADHLIEHGWVPTAVITTKH